MSTRNKVIITISSLCLVAAIIVVGVFAFATQTFSISNTITFTAAKNVSGTVTITAKKIAGGNDISATNYTNGSTVTVTNGTASFDGEEIQNINQAVSIADPGFTKKGDKLIVTIVVTNSTAVDEAFNVTLTGVDANDSTKLASESIGNGTNTDNIGVTIYYIDGAVDFDSLTTDSSNGASLAVSGTRTIVVVYELLSQKSNVSFSSSFGLALATPAQA